MRRKSGILIVAVMLTTVLVAMFIGAALSLAPFSLARGAKDQDWHQARAAAASGVEYALARLQSDPNWRAQANYAVPDADFRVQEGQGNVVGLVRSQNGRFAQFRMRFNWENGTPAYDPDELANSSNPLDFDLASLNNVRQAGDFLLPASGNHPALNIPGHSLYLAVQGRAGRACEMLNSNDLNPSLNGSWGLTEVKLRTIYKINNPGQLVDPAVGMSGGDLLVQIPQNTDKFLNIAGGGGQIPKLRSKAALQVAGGDHTFNLRASGSGLYRVPASTNPTASGLQNISRGTDENPGDAYYNLSWPDVKKADGSNTLKAGTYVWLDDGSLHYFDMSPAAYIDYAETHPNSLGQVVYQQSQGELAMGTGVNVTSTGTGAAMQATMSIHSDTAVTAASNTTELGILPQKGAADRPNSGSDNGSSANFRDWMLSGALTANGGSSYTLSGQPDIGGFFHQAAQWGDANGYGHYGGGVWTMGSISMELGIYNNSVQVPAGQWGNLQDAVNAYVNSGAPLAPSVYNLLKVQLGAQPTGNADGTVQGSTSLVDPKNLKVELKPRDGATSAVLSSNNSITLGAVVQGEGASIVSGKDVNLVGLGVDLSANPNATEGVSLFAANNIYLSTYDASAQKFNDVSLRGVIYAQGDIQANLGHPTLAADKWGKLKLNGSMVAYGGNPATQSPGQAATGNLDLVTQQGELTFDPSYLTSLMSTLPNNLRYGCWLWVLE